MKKQNVDLLGPSGRGCIKFERKQQGTQTTSLSVYWLWDTHKNWFVKKTGVEGTGEREKHGRQPGKGNSQEGGTLNEKSYKKRGSWII